MYLYKFKCKYLSNCCKHIPTQRNFLQKEFSRQKVKRNSPKMYQYTIFRK